MSTLSEALLLGSAKIDAMAGDIKKITAMMFGLASHPRHWIHGATLNRRWDDLYIEFGTIEQEGCVWAVWWKDGEFFTRCLSRDKRDAVVCVYGSELLEPHKLKRSFESPQQTHTKLRHGNGIPIAHRHLDVFARGMIQQFFLESKVAAFLIAWEHEE